MKILTIDGYTGAETEDQLGAIHGEKFRAAQAAVAAGTPADEATSTFTGWLDHHYARYGTALHHNAIARPAVRLEVLRRTILALLRAVDQAYDDLSLRTTTAWHAAHHRYVLAATEARAALTEQIEAGAELHAALAAKPRYITPAVYASLVSEADRQVDAPDLDALRAELDEFIETQQDRFMLTRATLAGTMPLGFEPAVPAQREPADEEIGTAAARW